MAKKESMIDKIKRLMYQTDKIRNIGIVAHVDHGKTTTTDSLLAGAGMLSFEVAGKACATDFLEVEQERGITVQNADVNMVHEYKGEEYLINLIDTPGHVDFGGHVTRAMRVIDGAVVICDAVEGVMPQTETVLRQALKEKVKPVLFINKVDRLISEIKLTPEKMQEQLMKIIYQVNELIRKLAPEEEVKNWLVNVQEGSVAFGSGLEKWAMSFPFMKETGLSFKDVLDFYAKGEEGIKELQQKAPLHKVLLDMIINHLPSPKEAQKYRIPRIWNGDVNSEIGKHLLECDPKGPLVACVSKVTVDPQAGEIALIRTFSGTLKKGQEVYLIGKNIKTKVQQLYVFKGDQRFPIDELPVGNLGGVVGLRDVSSGDTVSELPDVAPFEELKHLFEPVVTKAFEAKSPKDLPKLIDALRAIHKEDPTVHVKINRETGQNLVSGMGELHLEIIEDKLKREMGLDIVTSPPIVVYRETVTAKSPIVEGKSPNKHNKLYFTIEPLEEPIYKALESGEISVEKIKKKDEEVIQKFMKYGMSRDEAKRIKGVHNSNLFIDNTRGIIHLGEIMEYMLQAFRDNMDAGPLAKEPIARTKFVIHDARLHEDAIHRGPAQIIPAVREALREAFLQAKPTLLEPVQTIRIDTPEEYMGNVTKLITNRRGQLLDVQQEGGNTIILAKVPVANMFGITGDLRSVSEGRAVWFLVDSTFERIPKELEAETIKRIRERKGIDPNARIA